MLYSNIIYMIVNSVNFDEMSLAGISHALSACCKTPACHLRCYCSKLTICPFCTILLPRDASAERGNATVSRLSVRPSVCLSVTFRYQQHIGWNSSKIISQPNSLGPLLWLTPNMGDLVQREHPQN